MHGQAGWRVSHGGSIDDASGHYWLTPLSDGADIPASVKTVGPRRAPTAPRCNHHTFPVVCGPATRMTAGHGTRAAALYGPNYTRGASGGTAGGLTHTAGQGRPMGPKRFLWSCTGGKDGAVVEAVP